VAVAAKALIAGCLVYCSLLHELGHMFGMGETDFDHFTIGNNPDPDATPVHASAGDRSAAKASGDPGERPA